ncbi:MAG: hypothetical protein GY710_05760 [Desulfobacteraceae bacterium]|nr:hypothetical protein [Desulfobacteraceae bacterium]
MLASIKIRNQETIEKIEQLKKPLNMTKKTGIIDHVIFSHLNLVSTVKTQEQKIYNLENELKKIKSVLTQKIEADKEYKNLCNVVMNENRAKG